jgi:hypothetical protein
MTILLAPPPRHLRSATRLAAAIAALGSLAACASDAGYPSLTPRAVETSAQAPAGDDATPTVPIDAALDRRVASLSAQVASGHAAFQKAAASGCAAIARGARAVAGSEPWIAAQQAISAVAAARAPVLAAVSELDRLVIERGTAGGDASNLAPLIAAQAQASAMDSAEQARLAALTAGNCAG